MTPKPTPAIRASSTPRSVIGASTVGAQLTRPIAARASPTPSHPIAARSSPSTATPHRVGTAAEVIAVRGATTPIGPRARPWYSNPRPTIPDKPATMPHAMSVAEKRSANTNDTARMENNPIRWDTARR